MAKHQMFSKRTNRNVAILSGFTACLLTVIFILGSCTYSSDTPEIAGRDIRLTIMHTSDIHSRILPFDHSPMYTEQQIGMVEDRGPYGGIARVSTIIKEGRRNSGRMLYLDSGDLFQGAPIFNLFQGEPEIRTMSHLGLDAMALGNHEFDAGTENLVEQFEIWADFPVLAANYRFELTAQPYARAFERLVEPWTIFNVQGLKVGVIGMGNLSSMTSLEDSGNSMSLVAVETLQVVQDYVNLLRPQVDLVILLSHLGLTEDQDVAKNICGLDVILGGHHHIALVPPKVIPYDPDPEVVAALDQLTTCSDSLKRDTLLIHSQAFAKFVGRLDLVVRDGRIRSHKFDLIPIDTLVPEDPELWEVLEPYYEVMNREYDLDRIVAHALVDLRRFGSRSGDSMLGNFVCEAMQYRRGVETDFCLTNSLGMRTDVLEGEITLETLYNVLPFENTITTMYLSGLEVKEMLDYATQRSSGRGCSSQIQVSNCHFKMNCRTGEAEDIYIAGQPLELDNVYELATNNYIAWGGSGFDVLERNTTKVDTGISMRDAVIDYMKEHPALPECHEDVDDITRCTNGIAVEDGRIMAVY